MAVPQSESQFGGLLVARGRSDGVDLQDQLQNILAQIRTVDAGLQLPDGPAYTNYIAQQLQDAHDQVWLSSDLKTVGDPMGDMRPQDSTDKIIVEGNGPSRTVTVRSIAYSVTWNGSEYVVTQRRL